MTTNKTIIFQGHITTESPVAISVPGISGMPRNSHNSTYIPAQSIRGMFRHTAHMALTQLMHQNNQLFTIDEHYMLASGVDTARKSKLGGGYETIGKNLEIREKNPLLSLFGNFTVSGLLKVGNAFAMSNENVTTIIGNGSRNHPFNRNPNLIGFVDETELPYLKDVMKADALASLEVNEINDQIAKIRSENKTATAEEKKENLKLIDELNTQIRLAKDARIGASETILRTTPGFEAIDRGHKLSHTMKLTQQTETDLNFLLWLLTKVSADFSIGGHRNLGCGDVSAEWNIYEQSFSDSNSKLVGTVRINDKGFAIEGIDFDFAAFEKRIIDGDFDFKLY